MFTNYETMHPGELLILRVADKIICHITGTVNDCYCHATALLKSDACRRCKNVTPESQLRFLSRLFWLQNAALLSEITQWSGVMTVWHFSVGTNKGVQGRTSLWPYYTVPVWNCTLYCVSLTKVAINCGVTPYSPGMLFWLWEVQTFTMEHC